MPHHAAEQANGNSNNNQGQKLSKRQMRQDIRDLQQWVLQAEEEQQQVQRENQALQAQAGGRGRSLEVEDHEANAAGQKKLSKSEILAWKSKAKIAGGRVVALYEPFLNIDQLAGHLVQIHIDEILDDIKQAKSADNGLGDEHNPAIYWDIPHFHVPGPIDMAREMIYHLPKSPGKIWLEDWFQEKASRITFVWPQRASIHCI
ncbi:hypothetical protein CTheo_9133 [Ceratobasidium theobromae]|uniref:Uncharacterized protein n=1 Tax=Ceratobasidium theobromae TaxID=1582974 RepID=A0A5N5Q6L2_9AGAM|nr:hypothetical protein CTheo_9133 [Ceratobasidium theobromae]